MANKVEEITVVGGGDSGLIAALCIEKLNPDVEITIVDDFHAQPSEIGKSTYKLLVDILHQFLEISEERFIEEVKPIWKASVYFKDWCGYTPFHFPFDHLKMYPNRLLPNSIEQYHHIYNECYLRPDFRTNNEEMVHQQKTPYVITNEGNLNRYRSYAYHFDVHRFNSFLRELCTERGISLVNDEIVDVTTNGTRIVDVRSETSTYSADLYIDATGFKRVLKNELGGTFRDFGLPLNAAFNTRIERPLSDVVPATVIETGAYGWFWQIDTFDSRDLGYVYASDFVDDDEAVAEFVRHSGGSFEADQVSKYEFTSGYYEDAWATNCVSIGNAEGFVEPLQSTGLTANAQAAVILSILLSSHGCINDAGIRSTFNSCIESIWESIYDFVSVHYAYSAGTTDFWKTMQSVRISPRTEQIIKEFDINGIATDMNPIEHHDEINNLMIFPLVSFFAIMRSMGAESTFYENADITVSDDVKDHRESFFASMRDEVNEYLTYEEVYRGFSAMEREQLTIR